VATSAINGIQSPTAAPIPPDFPAAAGGIALNNILFYGTLGLAYGRGQLDVGGLSETNLHTGLAAGFGLEVGLTNSWSVKAEGLFNDYGNQPYAVIGTNTALTNGAAQLGVNYRFGLTNSVARLGVNYHF
jgi:opacity protein-like surface antigen